MKLISFNKITRMIQRPHSQSSRNLVTKFWANKWMNHPWADAYSYKCLPTLLNTRTKNKVDKFKANTTSKFRPNYKKQKSIKNPLSNLSNSSRISHSDSFSSKLRYKILGSMASMRMPVKNYENIIMDEDLVSRNSNLSYIEALNDYFSDLLSR
jgi:hypothetical protein